MKKTLTIFALVVSFASFSSCQKSGVEPVKVLPQLVISHPSTDANKTIVLTWDGMTPTGYMVSNQYTGAFTVDSKGSDIRLSDISVTGILQTISNSGDLLSQVLSQVNLVTADGDIVDTEDIIGPNNGAIIHFHMKNYEINQPTTFFILPTQIDGWGYELDYDALHFDVTGDNVASIVAYDANDTKQIKTPLAGTALSGLSTGAIYTFLYDYTGYIMGGSLRPARNR